MSLIDSKITVLGGGLMGHAIAYVFASVGHQVSVFEPGKEARDTLIERILRISESLETKDFEIQNILVPDSLEKSLSDCDLVIEAIPEKLELKKDIFDQCIKFAPKHAILATNTSGLPITLIAKDTKEPNRIVGTHFWNPPHLVPLVEVIESPYSDRNNIKIIMDLMRSAGKVPVHVEKDVPGFIGNRLQHALKREAIALVEQGICDAETVDLVVKEGFGQRLAVMGPLENSDLVGLNLTLDIHGFLLKELDNSARPQELLRNKVNDGKLGMSTGEGFRKWTKSESLAAQERLVRHLTNIAKRRIKKGS